MLNFPNRGLRPSPPRKMRCLLSAIVLAVCALSSCSASVTPGYRVIRESRALKFVSGTPPELRVKADYQLENSGTTDLQFVDVELPEEKRYGRQDLRVRVDGREVEAQKLPEELQFGEPSSLRVPLEPVWQRGQRRALSIEYAFRSPQDFGRRVTLGDADFHVSARGWYPALHPPKHFLAPTPVRPDKTVVTIQVPAGFQVLSRGRPAGKQQAGGDTVYRYLLRTGDLAPFAVGGRYVESASGDGSRSAVFWSFHPLSGDSGRAGQKITSAWTALQDAFGSLDRDTRGLHIVESSSLRGHLPSETGAAAVAFPGGALVNSASLELGIESDAFLDVVTHALAHNWFTVEIYPPEFAEVGMSEGLSEYATIVVDEARGGAAARRQRILKFLGEYDAGLKVAVEIPIGQSNVTDPPEQRRIAFAKAALFYIALEDSYGETSVRGGLKNFVALMRGQPPSYSELRSALEQSTGKDLAEPFRIWLYSKGIPKDFLDRYGAPAEIPKAAGGN
jgi:hypothetical protein